MSLAPRTGADDAFFRIVGGGEIVVRMEASGAATLEVYDGTAEARIKLTPRNARELRRVIDFLLDDKERRKP